MNKKQLFEEYLMQNVDSAYRFARTYANNREDAEDIVNESVIKALKSINALRDTQSMKPWFYKIIVNTALTHLKKSRKVTYLQYDEFNEKGEDDSYDFLTLDIIGRTLEPKYSTIVVLRFLEGMSLKEISELLDLNENTVKTRLYKALKLLKIEMEGEECGEI